MFEKVSAQLVSRLRALVGEKRVLTGDAIGADYGHDELPNSVSHLPEAVVEAGSTDDVAAVMKLCGEFNIPVTVRGAGTGRAGGSVPVEGGVLLSLRELNSILAFDAEARLLTVQPGVLLQDVKAEAARHGLYYPPDPGEKTATIGGNASTDASGPCAVKYGGTRAYIADALCVLADGSAARLSGNAALAAVVGSEGTLAVITELTLRLVEKPGCEVILLLPFADAGSCLAAAGKILAAGLDPAVLEYLDTDIVEFSGRVTGEPVFPVEMDGERVGATLMVTLDAGDDDALDGKMEAVAELAEELECLDILVVDTPTLKRSVWDAHDAFHTAMESGARCADEINLAIAPDKLAELIGFAKAEGEARGLRALCYAHAGSGGVHIHAVSDGAKDEFLPAMAAFNAALCARCAQLGGDLGGEYGLGYAKRACLKAALGDEKYGELVSRKTFFDPKGILNPGKII